MTQQAVSIAVVLPYAARCGAAAQATVTMRPLSGEDEIMLDEALSAGRSAAAVVSLLVGRCAADDNGFLGEDAARGLSLGDREIVLRALYAESFQPTFAARISCSECGEAIEFDVDLTSLAETPPQAGPHHRIRVGGHEIPCRVPTGDDLERALSEEDAAGALARACSGDVVVDVEALAQELSRLDPNAECALVLACPACGASCDAYLDAFELLRSALAESGGIVQQVDRLARAYGWSERDILALPRARRLRYCALAGAGEAA